MTSHEQKDRVMQLLTFFPEKDTEADLIRFYKEKCF